MTPTAPAPSLREPLPADPRSSSTTMATHASGNGLEPGAASSPAPAVRLAAEPIPAPSTVPGASSSSAVPTASPMGPVAGADPLTQLEAALDLLLQIVASTVAYLTRKAPHVAARADAPLSMLGATAATILVDEQTMAASIDELVADLVRQASVVRGLIETMPAYDTQTQGQETRLEKLQTDMAAANKEYAAVVQEASTFSGTRRPCALDT